MALSVIEIRFKGYDYYIKFVTVLFAAENGDKKTGDKPRLF